MPTPPTAKWPKPRSEDEFEDIVVDFLRLRWEDPHVTRQGRRGQRQHGVDIVGHPPWLQGKTAGAQCKNTESLTLATVRAEVEKAKNFPGGLGEFPLVTAADRDAALQNEARVYFTSHPAPFRVQVVFWPDILAQLSGYPDLIAKHWKGFRGSAPQQVTLPPPARINRDGVRDEETKECQCELALLSPSLDIDPSELTAELKALVRARRGTDTPFDRLVAVAAFPELLRQSPTRTANQYTWSNRSRTFSNVIIKRELEVGGHGRLTYRWAEFMTEESIFRTTLLIPGVIIPLALHRLALARAASTLGLSAEGEAVIKFTAHGSSALVFLDDMQPQITEPFLLSVARSEPDWSFEIKATQSGPLHTVAVRVLNRALSHFESAEGTAIRVKTAAISQLLPRESS